jgi:hypothetical protein
MELTSFMRAFYAGEAKNHLLPNPSRYDRRQAPAGRIAGSWALGPVLLRASRSFQLANRAESRAAHAAGRARGVITATRKMQANSGLSQIPKRRIVSGATPTMPGRIASAATAALQPERPSMKASRAAMGAATSASPT